MQSMQLGNTNVRVPRAQDDLKTAWQSHSYAATRQLTAEYALGKKCVAECVN